MCLCCVVMEHLIRSNIQRRWSAVLLSLLYCRSQSSLIGVKLLYVPEKCLCLDAEFRLPRCMMTLPCVIAQLFDILSAESSKSDGQSCAWCCVTRLLFFWRQLHFWSAGCSIWQSEANGGRKKVGHRGNCTWDVHVRQWHHFRPSHCRDCRLYTKGWDCQSTARGLLLLLYIPSSSLMLWLPLIEQQSTSYSILICTKLDEWQQRWRPRILWWKWSGISLSRQRQLDGVSILVLSTGPPLQQLTSLVVWVAWAFLILCKVCAH